MSVTLSGVEVRGRGLELRWSDGRPNSILSFLWFRDHCTAPESQHPETKQRLVDTSRIAADLSALSVTLEDGGRTLRLVWPGDRHVSRFDAQFLAALRTDPDALPIVRVTWDRESMSAGVPHVAYEGVMADDSVLKEYLEAVARYGFCFVEGVPASPEATRAVATRIAYIRETIFGGYWDFTANMEHKDTAYTSMAIGPHTDGTYSFDAPGYQMFHCLAADCTGGENMLIDGFRIAEIMRREDPSAYQTLTEIAIPGRYLDDSLGVHLMARRPLFRVDEAGELVQVSYNNLDRAPFLPGPERELAFYRALAAFDRLCNDPALQFRRRLLPGSVLLFDNWRVLHARDAYVGYRRLAGVYLNKEDVESRLRFLRVRAGEPV